MSLIHTPKPDTHLAVPLKRGASAYSEDTKKNKEKSGQDRVRIQTAEDVRHSIGLASDSKRKEMAEGTAGLSVRINDAPAVAPSVHTLLASIT